MKFSVTSSFRVSSSIRFKYVANPTKVLLRTIEYFEGIMFLTTNRVASIDRAFQSRIHLSIAYPSLSPESRRELWITFIVAGCAGNRPEWLDDAFLDKIVSTKINGRQIRNIVRITHSLAANAGRNIIPEDVLHVLEAHESFEGEFSKKQAKRRNTAGHRANRKRVKRS